MTMNATIGRPAVVPDDTVDFRRPLMVAGVSWGAVLAGVVSGLVAQLVLSMLGAGIGLATVAPSSGDTPSASTLSLGAVAWIVVSGIAASALGGFLAGRLSGRAKAAGGYHGFVSWAASTIVVVVLLSSALGGLASGTFGALSAVVSGAGHAVGGTLQTALPALTKTADPLAAIEDQVKSASGDQDPAALRAEAAKAIGAVLSGDGLNQQAATDRAADLLAKARNIPVDQAKDQVNQFRTQYLATVAETKRTAEAAAESAARASSYAAFTSAIALCLGALAAVVGGRWGATKATWLADDL